MKSPFISTVRVLYNETDQMGYVHHNNYVNYYEAARWEMFQHLGIPYKMIEDRGYMLPVVSVSIKYFKPAFYDDELTIETTIQTTKGAKLLFVYRMFNQFGEIINVADISLAFIKKETRKSCRPPEFVLEKMI
jgi:acyl-CoA thioester hydrolase